MSDNLTIAIIQARMNSRRLPNKVLLDIDGHPMLVHVVERTRRAKTIDNVIVATTSSSEDDPLFELCNEIGYSCYRGSTFDVLDRYYNAARQFNTRVVVRITGDCPLIDPEVIDKTVNALPGYDFVANRLPPPWGRTYPIGLDTEVCSFSGLEVAWREADLPHQREHVMPYFYDHQDRFRIRLVNHSEDFGSLRWTVDTPEDLSLMRLIFQHFSGRNDFSWLEVLELFKQKPELAQINSRVRHKVYDEVDDRMER